MYRAGVASYGKNVVRNLNVFNAVQFRATIV